MSALFVALVLVSTLFFGTVLSLEKNTPDSSTSHDLQQYMEDVVAGYKLSLRKSALLQQHSRKRRSINIGDFLQDNSTTGMILL